MALAVQTLDFDDGLAILTEMIVSEIGPPSALRHGQARAAAVARVERLLDALMRDEPPAQPADRAREFENDIQFGRLDAEYAFEEATGRG